MAADLFQRARDLQVIDVWKPGNPTGWVTPKVLYDPAEGKAPEWDFPRFWMDHGTVGTNTLRFWGEGSSAVQGNWTLAHYLVPRDYTQYRDGAMHDTRDVVFKMVPDGLGCNHTGLCLNGVINNTNTIGCEYESRQDGTADITDRQYEKGALIYTYAAALHHIRDYFRVPHGLVAEPWGRRTDPWAGQFDIARSWELVQQIRADARVWALWGLPQPKRGY